MKTLVKVKPARSRAVRKIKISTGVKSAFYALKDKINCNLIKILFNIIAVLTNMCT